MRKITFENEGVYHVYNHAVEQRNLFLEDYDFTRFLESMEEFNAVNPIGSLYENSYGDQVAKSETEKLVDIIAYCLNPNHFHLILQQVCDDGISKFMKRLGGGYSWHYNAKYQRKGTLFQGPFKAVNVDSNEYLLHLSAYVNLNNRVHRLGKSVNYRSSWDEYIDNTANKRFCSKQIILDQFRDSQEYRAFTEESLKISLDRKDQQEEFKKLLLE